MANPTLDAGIRDEKQFLGIRGSRSSLDDARFLVLPVPFEKTTSFQKGTFAGPAAFIAASGELETWDEEVQEETWKRGIYTLPPFGSRSKAEAFFPDLKARVKELAAREDQTLFVIGGEHSITQATAMPFVEKYKDISILHFDAHADLRKEYEGTPHNHACALHPFIGKCPIVQVGIRSISPDEEKYCNKDGVHTFPYHANRDIPKLIERAKSLLTDRILITIDVDGYDPSVIPGTGTPQPGGFLWYDALDLFRECIKDRKVQSVEIMEILPEKHTVRTEFASAKLAYRLMGYVAKYAIQ